MEKVKKKGKERKKRRTEKETKRRGKKKPAGGAGSRRCSSGRAEPEERSAAGSSGSSVRLKSPQKRRLPALRLRVRILSSASRRRQHRPASGCGAEAALSPEFSAPAQRGPSSVWPQGWRRVRTPHSVPDRPNSGSGAPGPDAALRRRCSAPGSRWVPSSAPRFLPFLHSSIGVEPKSCLFQVQIPAHFSTLHKAAFPNLSVPRIPHSPTPAFLELGVPQTRRSHAQLPQLRLSLHSAFPKSDALQTRFPTPNLFHPISASFTPGLSQERCSSDASLPRRSRPCRGWGLPVTEAGPRWLWTSSPRRGAERSGAARGEEPSSRGKRSAGRRRTPRSEEHAVPPPDPAGAFGAGRPRHGAGPSAAAEPGARARGSPSSRSRSSPAPAAARCRGLAALRPMRGGPPARRGGK